MFWHGKWKHFTRMELKEQKCTHFTSEEQINETIWTGEFLRDGSVSSSLCPFYYRGKVKILENEWICRYNLSNLGALMNTAVHEMFTMRPNV